MPLPYVRIPSIEYLWLAIRAGNLQEVLWCIENGVLDVNEEVHLAAGGKATLLAFALKYGHLKIAAFLLEKRADPNGHLNRDSCLLCTLWGSHYSSEDHVSMVELLLDCKADPNQMNERGDVPLRYVCQRHDQSKSNLRIVELLLKARAQPDGCAQENDGRPTPLMRAASNNYIDWARMLLIHGASPYKVLTSGALEQLSVDMQLLLLTWPYLPDDVIVLVERNVENLKKLLHEGTDPTEGFKIPDVKRLKELLEIGEYTNEEITMPGLEEQDNSTSLLALAGCEDFCMTISGQPPSQDIVQTLKRSMSWRPARHYLFPPSFRSGVFQIYLVRKRHAKGQTVLSELSDDVWLLIISHLPRDWGLA